jgi:HIV-1 Vpr-binding protein
MTPHASETKLWKRENFANPAITFPECYRAQFNRTADQIVGTTQTGALIYSTATGQRLRTLVDGSIREKRDNTACFSPCGELVLNDTLLWDPRASTMIHKFDKFSNYGSGLFNPSGNEVIINSEIWDLRTFKLIKTCPALDQTSVSFNPLGDVIYAVVRQFEKKIRELPFFSPFTTVFRTLDASNYSLINTIDHDKQIIHLAPDKMDNYIMLVENGVGSSSLVDSVCRIYEVGKRRATDSDSEASMSEDEDEESSSESESSISSDGSSDNDTFGSMDSEGFDSENDLFGDISEFDSESESS